MKQYAVLALLVALLSNQALADVTPSSLFSDHMILQKGVLVPVWGTAENGEKVTVTFNGQTASATTTNGKWMVKLAPLPYLLTPSVLTISGKNTVTISDVLVGEVWLCSGQSNMERQLGPRPPQPPLKDWEKERDSANYPQIREYYVPLKYSTTKVDDVHNQWTVCSPKTVSEFSAVGYFMARDLHRQLKVPIGIIFSAFGGTPAEDWTSTEALTSNPELAQLVKDYNVEKPGYKPAGKVMSGLYNGMIYPLIPYAIRGVAWYQGESNVDYPKEYLTILPNMIRNWRQDFGQGDLPFLIVQIAPHKEMTPEIREAQAIVAQKVANTALIVTTDVGDPNDIHPPNKQPVGYRLSLAARGLAYGEKLAYQGPSFQSFKVKGNKIILRFAHADGGLTSNNATLKGFTIAGDDKNFVEGTAEIKGKKVIVTSPAVSKPVTVRYGWSNAPDVNLYNAAGLPAVPFRTDP